MYSICQWNAYISFSWVFKLQLPLGMMQDAMKWSWKGISSLISSQQIHCFQENVSWWMRLDAQIIVQVLLLLLHSHNRGHKFFSFSTSLQHISSFQQLISPTPHAVDKCTLIHNYNEQLVLIHTLDIFSYIIDLSLFSSLQWARCSVLHICINHYEQAFQLEFFNYAFLTDCIH